MRENHVKCTRTGWSDITILIDCYYFEAALFGCQCEKAVFNV